MKGKRLFTSLEIKTLKNLIALRKTASTADQKGIRQKMRNIGFYGKDDWGISDLQIRDLDNLINSGLIEVIGANPTPLSISQTIVKSSKIISVPKAILSNNTSVNLNSLLENFKLNRFNPQIDHEFKVDNIPGNYILCLQKQSRLPNTTIKPILKKFEGLKVIYTGIASISLRTRDYRQHFKGNNAGRSTLRKSLGVLFGYEQIPRDKNAVNTKTKFNDNNEQELTEWMHLNLIMFFLPTTDFNSIEVKLIHEFNFTIKSKRQP